MTCFIARAYGREAFIRSCALRILEAETISSARVTELLKQAQYSPLPISLMAASLWAVNKGFMDSLDIKQVLPFEAGLHAHFANTASATMDKINATGDWNDELEAAFKKGIEDFKTTGSW